MTIGLNEQELNSLLSFGDTAEEIQFNMFGTHDRYMGSGEKDAKIICSIMEKISKLVSENNKRIAEQLVSAGINLTE